MGAQVSFCIVIGRLTVAPDPLFTTAIVSRFSPIQDGPKPKYLAFRDHFVLIVDVAPKPLAKSENQRVVWPGTCPYMFKPTPG